MIKRSDGVFSLYVSDIRKAVKSGVNPNETNGFPAIINHILDKRFKCVKALIDLGADVNILVKHDRAYHEDNPIENRIYNEGTPLDFAMCNYANDPKVYGKIIELLLAHGAKNAHDKCLVASKPINLVKDKLYHKPWVDCTNNLLEGCEVYNMLHS